MWTKGAPIVKRCDAENPSPALVVKCARSKAMCAPSPVAVRRKFSRFQGGEKRHSFAQLLQRPSFPRKGEKKEKEETRNTRLPRTPRLLLQTGSSCCPMGCRMRPFVRGPQLGQPRSSDSGGRVSQRALVRPNQAAALPRGPRRTPCRGAGPGRTPGEPPSPKLTRLGAAGAHVRLPQWPRTPRARFS